MTTKPKAGLILLAAVGVTVATMTSIQIDGKSHSGQAQGGTGNIHGEVEKSHLPNPASGAQCKLEMPSDSSGLQSQINGLRTKIAGDQEALRRLRLENRADDFEQFQKLTECAKEDLQDQLTDIGVTALVETTKSAIKGMGPPIVRCHFMPTGTYPWKMFCDDAGKLSGSMSVCRPIICLAAGITSASGQS